MGVFFGPLHDNYVFDAKDLQEDSDYIRILYVNCNHFCQNFPILSFHAGQISLN
jgi:hypothetical protein